ncbi:odorant receptor Or2-like [Cylas formicarius]|uniref:odorant receptor Or2-like n=1 Tax=Cylas formicarius TaxID=197179 RepID=UPI0029588F49|nr:odorant receptor Or2-like [Cylas formicarius]XP_060524084.1 odorant receptor Or2-like [Cylas formicarius]XP_060524085.1 odorant receptor Or2-like [Cylas formicarius]
MGLVGDSKSIINFAKYCMISAVFVFAWSANEVKVQSLLLADALYDSQWYKYNEAAKKMVLTMMVRAQKPLLLTIGPFGALTTESALAIIRASYSYVTLMNQYKHNG